MNWTPATISWTLASDISLTGNQDHTTTGSFGVSEELLIVHYSGHYKGGCLSNRDWSLVESRVSDGSQAPGLRCGGARQ